MARPNRTDAPEDGAAERPMGPEITAIDEKPSPDDVLVFNSRAGVYQGHLSQAIPELSSERQQRLNMRTLRLQPGLNYTSRELFTKLADQPGLSERLARGEIVEIHSFAALSIPVATGYVKATSDVVTLQRLQAGEKRDAVADAISTQIRLASSDDEVPRNPIGRRATA